MRYVHRFQTENDYSEKRTNGYYEPWLSFTDDVEETHYNKSKRELLAEQPLTFEIISGGTILWKASDSSATKTIEYKLNDGEWTSITSASGSAAPSISVASGDTVQFRGNNQYYGYTYNTKLRYTCFSADCGFNIMGNIMSLINSTDYVSLNSFTGDYNFYRFFYNCQGLKSSKYLILPAATLTKCCYCGMFEGCTSLTTSPELPATTLANRCYSTMFMGCTSLTQAPELPATTLTEQCYADMFRDCTSLTAAPELPATILTENCYYRMFQGCSSLTTAPDLLATTLANQCYSNMFTVCRKLNYIKCLATDISANNYTYNWVNGVSSTGTFVKNPNATSWTTGTNGIPNGWTVQDAE